MMNIMRSLLLTGLMLPALVGADESGLDVRSLFGVPLADDELDRLRGGFLQDGLEISIGLDQIVSVNGRELIVNRLTIPNLNQPRRGREVEHTMETVVQILQPDQPGDPRVMAGPAATGSGWTTIIQNSLNSTVIQNIHQLNIELNNLTAGHQVPMHLGEHLNRLMSR
jgi:hypothetical protein